VDWGEDGGFVGDAFEFHQVADGKHMQLFKNGEMVCCWFPSASR
jgi:hypothetical protein